ncbi:unnamed protein product [Jaminaea pallidilutea]
MVREGERGERQASVQFRFHQRHLNRSHFAALPEHHVASASMPGKYRDPWAAREAWRRHPIFSMRFYARNMFPGLGWATGAFVLYLIGDTLAHPSNIEKLKEDAKKQRGEA